MAQTRSKLRPPLKKTRRNRRSRVSRTRVRRRVKSRQKTIGGRWPTRTRQGKSRSSAGSKTQKKIFARIKCSPKNSNQPNSAYTCYTDDSLNDLRILWNKKYPKSRIESTCPRVIHATLTELLQSSCKTEACWLKRKFVPKTGKMREILNESFRPEYPREWKSGAKNWLSNLDINRVMHQYEAAYRCFKFIGPTPIDFDKVLRTKKSGASRCVWSDMCNFKLSEQMASGKYKIGIIFNTDPHNKSGEHWISMFINIINHTIFFYDSTGDPIPPEIQLFIDRIVAQGKQLPHPITFTVDNSEGIKTHQTGGTECGVYSLFFIINTLINNLTAAEIKSQPLPDKYMRQFRKKLFNYDPNKRHQKLLK